MLEQGPDPVNVVDPSIGSNLEVPLPLIQPGELSRHFYTKGGKANMLVIKLESGEDRRFYYHFGVDIIGLARAAYENYRANRVVQGGSTVTQQLAKNLLFTEGSFTVSDRSFKRKILEVFLAVWLEWKFSKDDILTMYLNRVYLGAGTFGIEAAAQRYFNK